MTQRGTRSTVQHVNRAVRRLRTSRLAHLSGVAGGSKRNPATSRFFVNLNRDEVAARVVVSPLSNPTDAIDVTDALIRAIAQQLWQHEGGNDTLNWLEAELILHHIVSHGSRESSSRSRDCDFVRHDNCKGDPT